jgi:thymidylate synthase
VKGTVFSCLGELLWYLSGAEDLSFIRYYVPHYPDDTHDGMTVPDAYGPRLMGEKGHPNQLANVIEMLQVKPGTRRAVIQIFDAFDVAEKRKAVPCTNTLQFFIRDGQLDMLTSMRSNDAYLGLPHDVFAFTMLQEIIARSTCVELGTYKHAVGSLHLYDRNHTSARRYQKEGWQSSVVMPEMPLGNPWPAIEELLKAEREIRLGQNVSVDESDLPSYWADLLRLLKVYRLIKVAARVPDETEKDFAVRHSSGLREIATIRRRMVSRVFEVYIRQRESKLAAAIAPAAHT